MKTAFLFPLLLVAHLCAGQGYDRNWCFGIEAGINFSDTTNPMPFKTQSITHEATACISSITGNLLFYTAIEQYNSDYCKILDSNDQLINNGDSIEIYRSATNGLLIINAPEHNSRFYLFHIATYNNCSPSVCLRLLYSIIEIDSTGELSVISKNQLILNNVEERLAAVKYSDGIGWWILAQVKGPCLNRFYKILLTANGIDNTSTQDIGSRHCSLVSTAGEMKFAQQGNKLASALYGESKIDLFEFDRETGNLSNPQIINSSFPDNFPYGCEFSPNGNFLYITFAPLWDSIGMLYQYSIDDTSITGIEIWSDNNAQAWQIEYAPDNRIYFSSLNPSYLGVVNHPDALGLYCDFQPFSFYIGDSSYTSYGLPNFPNYNLDSPDISIIETRKVKNSSVKVYPNPANELLFVASGNPAFHIQQVTLHDLSGKEILTTTFSEIPVATLAKGLYFVSIRFTNGASAVRKVAIR